MATDQHTKTDKGIHLLDCLIILAKHAKTIILTTLVVMVLVYLYLFFSPNTYQATVRLLAPQQNLTMSANLMEGLGGSLSPTKGGGVGLSSMAAGLLGLKSPGEFCVSLLKSDTISDRIIKRFDLQKLYQAKYVEDLRAKLLTDVKIKSDREGIITIEVFDYDPKRAAEIANAYVEELDKLLQEMAISEAKGHLAFLEKEQSQANVNLAQAEEALRNFSEKNSVVQLDAQTKGMLDYISSLRAAIDTKEVQLQVLQQQATPANYDLIRIETEIKGLKEKLRGAEIQLDQTCVGDVCINTSKMPALGLSYVRLYREVKYREGVYQLFTKMVELARVDLVKHVAVIQVIDRAQSPERRFNKRTPATLLAGFVTFLVIVGGVFIREYFYDFKNREENATRLATLALYLQPLMAVVEKLKSLIKIGRN